MYADERLKAEIVQEASSKKCYCYQSVLCDENSPDFQLVDSTYL